MNKENGSTQAILIDRKKKFVREILSSNSTIEDIVGPPEDLHVLKRGLTDSVLRLVENPFKSKYSKTIFLLAKDQMRETTREHLIPL